MTTVTLTLSVTLPSAAVVVPSNRWERLALRVAAGIQTFVARRAAVRRTRIATELTRERLLASAHDDGRRAAVATGMGLTHG